MSFLNIKLTQVITIKISDYIIFIKFASGDDDICFYLQNTPHKKNTISYQPPYASTVAVGLINYKQII